MRLFTAALGAETNTFSPIPTSLHSFTEGMLYRPGEHPDEASEMTASLIAARRRVKDRGWTVVEGTCAHAHPAGVTTRLAYETLRDEILEQLRRAMPVDAVALGMHGAMVADGYLDCEGDLLSRVREIVGPKVVIGVELDPHCHLTAAMTKAADIIIIFKEYPHTDFRERADELMGLMEATVEGRVRPRMAVHDCRMIGIYHTPVEPMRGFVDKIRAREGTNGILSISIAHGFPWGDVPDMGTRILVIADGDANKAAVVAQSLGDELFALRGKTWTHGLPLAEVLDIAAAAAEGPIVLADSPDNPGGGAPGDATFVLKALLERPGLKACLGPLYDPAVVRMAHDVGAGATLDVRLGGKTGPTSGDPLDLRVLVTAVKKQATQSFAGTTSALGDAAALKVGDVHIVVTSIRDQGFAPDFFTGLGVDPVACKIVVVKSSQHFYAGFFPIAKKIIYLDCPGTLNTNFQSIAYKNIKRPIWPLD